MRQIRSADPWSAFLRPPGRSFDTGHGGTATRATPDPGSGGGPVTGRGAGDPDGGSDLPDVCRRVLARLGAAGRPQSLEQLQHGTGLGLLEIADAVETLRDRGLVTVEREIDEIVRLAPPADR
ncbi:hypothetical protein [Actinomadura harenae]|uniref:Uncharacterized protein n=1 Tax=Actinomadura harenae TaxID=2483351 RepID=A0A3M2LUU4_9ACTN|nr:hypothetical protein [Actinomadura harenae]RMI39785.1 hypothetical protein EBO15_28675 [Actinomadura harenae]